MTKGLKQKIVFPALLSTCPNPRTAQQLRSLFECKEAREFIC